MSQDYRKYLILCLASLLSGFISALFSQTQTGTKIANSPDSVVIRIGDIKITAKEVEKFLENLPATHRPFFSSTGRRQLADVIVNNKLMMKEAEKRGLPEREDVQLRLNIARESILTEAVLAELQKEVTVSDQEAQKYLDDHMAEFEEAKVRRIVIRSASSINLQPGTEVEKVLNDQEARAKTEEIRKRLLAGADFEELAAKFSNDSFSSGRGGDLGFIKRGTQAALIVPPLQEIIFSIKLGTISEVVQTPLGYEIVKVEERRSPKLEVVRKEIEGRVRKQKSEDLVQKIRSQNAIKIDEAYFVPVANAPAAATGDTGNSKK